MSSEAGHTDATQYLKLQFLLTVINSHLLIIHEHVAFTAPI